MQLEVLGKKHEAVREDAKSRLKKKNLPGGFGQEGGSRNLSLKQNVIPQSNVDYYRTRHIMLTHVYHLTTMIFVLHTSQITQFRSETTLHIYPHTTYMYTLMHVP